MSAESDHKLEKGGKAAAVALIAGIAIGLISSYVAYEITYQGAGPDREDHALWILITALVVLSMIFAIVLILMGAGSYWAPGLSGQEVTGFSEVRRKSP